MCALTGKIYRFYKYRVFPRISELRGTTRLSKFLEDLAFAQLKEYSGKPEGIFEKEWDNLIILDACRHDLYQEYHGKEIDHRITLGSTSREYVASNFGQDHEGIVYITANGFLADEFLVDLVGSENPFYEKYETIRTDWDSDLGATRPESVFRDAMSAAKLFPDKRKIVHFIQPHSPYIGYDFNYNRSKSRLEMEEDGSNSNEEKALDKAEKGELSQDKILGAYRNNLGEVMHYANKLAEEMSGRTVITADHGELLGENGLYGHPPGKNAEVLRKVPWHAISED